MATSESFRLMALAAIDAATKADCSKLSLVIDFRREIIRPLICSQEPLDVSIFQTRNNTPSNLFPRTTRCFDISNGIEKQRLCCVRKQCEFTCCSRSRKRSTQKVRSQRKKVMC